MAWPSSCTPIPMNMHSLLSSHMFCGPPTRPKYDLHLMYFEKNGFSYCFSEMHTRRHQWIVNSYFCPKLTDFQRILNTSPSPISTWPPAQSFSTLQINILFFVYHICKHSHTTWPED
jgi:hypothetical protein